jgi:hypothetical protein
MRDYFFGHFEHFLFILLLFSRLGDIGTTYALTPKMKLEANPIAKRFGWPFALITLLVCFVPYYSPEIAIILIVISLLVSASNASKLWLGRILGETKLYELLLKAAKESKPVPSTIRIALPSLFIFVLAALLFMFFPSPHDWGYYFAFGIGGFALVLFVYPPLYYFKLRRLSRKGNIVS